MAYQSWSVVYQEQPSAAKWNILGTNDEDANTRLGVLDNFTSDVSADFVTSGCVWSGDAYGSTRFASMSAGVVYINGIRVSVSAVTSRQFTASRDTYIDVNTSGTITYSEVTNNNTSPALAANNIRIGIIVTGASSIASAASINQGSFAATLPSVSGSALRGVDSLGNKIYNPNPVDFTNRMLPTTDANSWKVYSFGGFKHYFKRVTFSQSIGLSAFLSTSSSNLPVGVSNFQNHYFLYNYTTNGNAFGLNVVGEFTDSAGAIAYTAGSIDGTTRTYTGWIDQYLIGP